MKSEGHSSSTSSLGVILLFLLVIFSSVSSTAAQLRKRSSPFTEQTKNVKPKRSLSVEELSDSVFEELNQFHNMGVAATMQIPNLAVRVHRLVVEGSADEGQEFDKYASGRALVALKTGSDRFMSHISDQATSIERHLRELDPDGNSRDLSAKNVLGIVVFTLLITFLIVLVVTNLISATTGWPGIPFFNSDSKYLSGTPGIDYRKISPCNRVPLQITPNRGEAAAPNYSYLPVTGGFIRNIIESVQSSDAATSVVSVLESIFSIETVLADKNNLPPSSEFCRAKNFKCKLTSDCCTSDVSNVTCVVGPNEQFCQWTDLDLDGKTYEPFCALWSKTEDGNSIDTFAFVPLTLWPPIKPVPLITILPLCPIPLNDFAVPPGAAPLGGCKACEFILGFPIADFNINGVPFKLTIQWGGVALSWANNAKLAFGTNVAISGDTAASTPQIWDGFREFDLPEVPDINFWTQFTINIVPLPAYTLIETRCRAGGIGNKIKAYSPTTAAKELYLKLDFEIYIAFDKQTYGTGGDGNATATAEKLATDLGSVRGRKRKLNYKEGQMLWRDLQNTGAGEDPCVIISMTAARIKMPLIGTLFFGNGIGGFCNFSPEESGVRCTPSGFFFNLKQEFKIEGGLLGLLASVLSEQTDSAGMPSQSTGNSIGIFQNEVGENEAVVFRLEFPVTSLFGVSIGSGSPFVHFQLVKGSEVERRRQTMLRTKTGDGPWIPNCAQVDIDCATSGWSPFYKDQAEADLDNSGSLDIRTEICSDILLNRDNDPDKLLYYNRIMTAEPLDPANKYKIEPPADSSFKLAKKYDFENNPDANIIIAYMGISDICAALIICIRRLSVTLIFSDRAPIMEGIIPEEFNKATELFNGIRNLDKLEQGGLWHPPDAFNFPDLSEYEKYLPKYDESRTEILDYTGAVTRAETFNDLSSNNAADQMAAFVRIFCQITVLFAADIQLGFIMTNFADVAEIDASVWAIVGQFRFELLGLEYDFAVSTRFSFDSRRRRHLLEEGPESYERALAADGIGNAAWDVAFSMGCVPGSLCEAFVEFFEDVGEAIWDGMVSIANFFVEDLGQFASDAIAAVGEWGRNLIGGITDFADKAVTFIADQFKNGEVARIVNGPRLEAFGDDAVKIYSTFTDGKFTIDDIAAIGDILLLAVDAIGIAFDFLVAGITDVVNAIGAVFLNVVGAVGDFLFGGEPWDELRTAPAYADINDCYDGCKALIENDPGNVFEIKRKCWCMDELECPVKPPQKQRCNVKSWCFSSCTDCGIGWGYVEVENTNTPITDPNRFPRFAGRKFDEACRKERMADIAFANNINKKMDKTGKLVDGQFNSNIMGLSSYSPSTRTEQGRRLRRLQNQVDSVSIPMTKFISEGVIPDQPIPISGQYSGVRLSPVSTTPTGVSDQMFESMIDLSDYKANPLFSDDENYQVDNGTAAILGARRGAAVPFLGELKLEEPDYLDRQPTVEPPTLQKSDDRTIMLDCTNARIAEAWRIKLQSSDPESLRRRRTRRHLQVGRGAMTILETTVEGVLMNIIKAGGVLSVTPGSIDGGKEDVFEQTKKLLGTSGAGSFLDPSRRRRLRVDLSSYDMDIKVIEAEAQSDRMYWRFAITVSDTTGTSNTQEVDAEIMYGAAELANAPPTEIQTRCDTSPYLVEGLEDDRALKLLMNETTFKVELRLDNCPSPFLYIEPLDDEIQKGVPCTKTFAKIERRWLMKSAKTKLPVSDDPMYIQTITRGGLMVDGSTGVPDFALKDAVYFLPNKRNAKVATTISDFYKDNVEPRTECGFCGEAGKQGITFSHPQDFECSDVGKITTISITTLNSIGEAVTKTANVEVLDQWGPNIMTKSHTVYLNQYGWLNKTDRVAVADIDDATWDNCGIKSRSVSPTPLYECGDEGLHTTTLTVTDVNGNVVTKEEVVIVDDSSRLGIGDDEILDLSSKSISDKLVKNKMKADFGYKKCKAIAVYVRPGGESNFKSLEYAEDLFPKFDDFNPSKKWNIPACKDDKYGEDLRFHQALCGNFDLTGDDIGDIPCEGDIKVEVLCEDKAVKKVKKKKAPLFQTCYRAKLSAANQCLKGKKKNKHNSFSHVSL